MKHILFDFDGIIRFYPQVETVRIEERFGLVRGTIDKIAFDPRLLEAVTTGKISRAAWISAIGEYVGSQEVADSWNTRPIFVDRDMIAMIDRIKELANVHLITNGTENLINELNEIGLSGFFQQVFNSAQIGFAKPDPRIFQFATYQCDAMPEDCVFVDDSIENISTAAELGIPSYHYFQRDVSSLEDWLRCALH